MPTSEGIRFGRYRLAGPHGPLLRHTRMVPLQPKALAVLWELVSRAGGVVTKEELFAAVWPNTVVTDGVITACLRDLRRALREDLKAPRYIATVHRIGYRFIAEVARTQSALEPEFSWQPAEYFVGRDAELARLHSAFAKALCGQCQLVFVTGEAGIGKSALTETFLAQLVQGRQRASRNSAASNLWLAHGQCIEHYGQGEAYLPILESLGRLCRQSGGEN